MRVAHTSIVVVERVPLSTLFIHVCDPRCNPDWPEPRPGAACCAVVVECVAASWRGSTQTASPTSHLTLMRRVAPGAVRAGSASGRQLRPLTMRVEA